MLLQFFFVSSTRCDITFFRSPIYSPVKWWRLFTHEPQQLCSTVLIVSLPAPTVLLHLDELFTLKLQLSWGWDTAAQSRCWWRSQRTQFLTSLSFSQCCFLVVFLALSSCCLARTCLYISHPQKSLSTSVTKKPYLIKVLTVLFVCVYAGRFEAICLQWVWLHKPQSEQPEDSHEPTQHRETSPVWSVR